MKVYLSIAKFLMSLSVPAPIAYILPIILLIGLIFILIQILSIKKEKKKIKQTTETGIPLTSSGSGRIGTRHFNRTEIQEKVSFTTDNHPDNTPCKLVDISLSGLAFVTPKEVTKDEKVRVYLPNLDKDDTEESFTVSGTVVRIKDSKKNNEYGVHFFHIMNRETELLKILINCRGKK